MVDSIRIVLIEDNPDDADILKEHLEVSGDTSFELEWFDHLSTGIERLCQGGVDLILLDMNLPDSTSLDTLRQTQKYAPSIPIIILSGLDDESTALAAVQAGAQDYQVKGRFTGDALIRSLHYAIERKRLEEEVREKFHQAEEAEAKLAAALNCMGDGFCQVDLQGNISYLNPAGENLLSCKLEMVRGLSFHDLTHCRSPEINRQERNVH